MCHIVKWMGAHKVKQSIRCYKVVIKAYDKEDGKYSYHPVFYNSHTLSYEVGTTYKTERPSRPRGYNMVVNRGLHSFRTDVCGWIGTARWLDLGLEGDTSFSDWNNLKAEAAVLECEIPKGSWYFEGEANCIFGGHDEAGYVSDTLVVLREVPRSEWPSMTFNDYAKRRAYQ